MKPSNLPTANQPRRHLDVQILPLLDEARRAVTPAFWRLVGDLVAEVLLDGVEGPWGTTETLNDEILAS